LCRNCHIEQRLHYSPQPRWMFTTRGARWGASLAAGGTGTKVRARRGGCWQLGRKHETPCPAFLILAMILAQHVHEHQRTSITRSAVRRIHHSMRSAAAGSRGKDIRPMRVYCALLTVAKFAFWVLAIGILDITADDVQTFSIEPVIVAGATAYGSSRRGRERRLPCRPMHSSHSCWNGCRSYSTDADTERTPATEPGTHRPQPEFTVSITG
jgi:hypothetical protein